MVSKCANQACAATFRYWHEGKILLVEVGPAPPEKLDIYALRRLERFWLCDDCSKTMTIVSHPSGVLVVPLEDQSKPKKGSGASAAAPRDSAMGFA